VGWLAAALLLACSGASDLPVEVPTETTGPASWVTVFDPHEAWTGYTLAFYAHRTPILLDMNGRIVHRWSEARVKSRIRLLPDGSLLGIALGRGVVEYSWEGDKTWEFASELGFAHHDVIRLASGNTATLIRPDKGRFDIVLEVDRAGQVVWQWHAADHLQPFVPPKGWSKVDVTHLNSIQELPSNHRFDSGDERFRPGNLLMSAREMNLLFIVDKATGNLVWTFTTDLDKQHEPLMVGPDSPRAGNILTFNNRYGSFYEDRQSTVLEIDPSTNRVLWQFRTSGFYSPTSGVQQPLPNGNVLITSSRGGRTFEVNRAGRVVWEWAPSFDTTRSHRYSYDHTPQLLALGHPQEIPVRPTTDHRHIDTDVYRFARRGLRRDIRLDRQKVSVLKYNNDCRNMVLPRGAQIEITYGLHAQQLANRGRSDYSARFRLGVRPLGSAETFDVFEDIVDLKGSTWRTRTLDLQPYGLRRAALCIATDEVGAPDGTATEEFALWQQPVIQVPRADDPPMADDELLPGDLTPEELENQKKHLEALGYIN